MDVGLHGWGVHPGTPDDVPKVHCYRLLYFKSKKKFFMGGVCIRSSSLLLRQKEKNEMKEKKQKEPLFSPHKTPTPPPGVS